MKKIANKNTAFATFAILASLFVGLIATLHATTSTVQKPPQIDSAINTFPLFYTINALFLLFLPSFILLYFGFFSKKPHEKKIFSKLDAEPFFHVYKLEEFRNLVKEIKRNPGIKFEQCLAYSLIFIAIAAFAIILLGYFGIIIAIFSIILAIRIWVRRHRDIRATAAFHIGNGLINMGKNDEALKVAEGILKYQPNSATGLWLKANALSAEGSTPNAIEIYEQLLGRHPSLKRLILPYIGLAHQNMGDYEKAEQIYLEALKIDTGSPESHYGLSGVLAVRGEYQKAFYHLEESLKLGYGDLKSVENDNDFKNIKENQRFKEILDTYLRDKKITTKKNFPKI